LLHRHAADIWKTGSVAEAADLDEALRGALGEAAPEAVRMVEAYALGSHARRGGRFGEDGPGPDFVASLDMMLNGVEQAAQDLAPVEPESGRPAQVIQSELWQLLRKMRESAELSYARDGELIELDRRILFILHNAGPLVPADISGAVGVDKAQVSRSVKRLLEMALLERAQIRAPLRLTREGEVLARRMLRLAELRNRELTFDVSDEELAEFFRTVEALLDRAVVLYEQERDLAHSVGRPGDLPGPGKSAERRAGEAIVIDRTRIISPLMTLSAYFSRSGALAFKRLTGLSTFEAFVLSEIGVAPPVEWGTLVAALNRDHSQAGRTIKALMDRGLVEREGRPGRRHGRFYPSAQGAELFAVIHQAGRERSAYLMEPMGDDQRLRFMRTFNKIRRNAEAQLQRERAFAELDRD
jgi:DNA-binding MarR family transcriptional regulator